ncbi:protein Shroom3-like [Periophthalmus magnuspinnatus]|uniref:protein Shroom3-like n=1 Tax=Periophthalmus magnuspinnatus TaxID=409849 RepID=UPI0024365F24|nr:protein Shroom3-like [Periophthalmus magnuspinnatus]
MVPLSLWRIAADLLSGLGSGGGVSWSLESLQPHTSGPPGAAHLVPRSSSSCLQLSSTRSSSSDLLHCKRNTAYSSCSPSLSFPEDLGVGSERSFSLESVQQTADLKRIQHKPYGLDSESRARVRLREQSAGRAYYHGTSENRLLNRHSLGPIWSSGQSSYENLKGALAPQRLSDSYTATSSEQLSSWSSLEHARSLRSVRSQQKGGSTTLSAKGLYTTEGQLHTVIEKSPESSPSSKPRQVQSPGPPRPTNHASGSNLGLNPTPHREHWDGYAHTYHRALEAER